MAFGPVKPDSLLPDYPESFKLLYYAKSFNTVKHERLLPQGFKFAKHDSVLPREIRKVPHKLALAHEAVATCAAQTMFAPRAHWT